MILEGQISSLKTLDVFDVELLRLVNSKVLEDKLHLPQVLIVDGVSLVYSHILEVLVVVAPTQNAELDELIMRPTCEGEIAILPLKEVTDPRSLSLIKVKLESEVNFRSTFLAPNTSKSESSVMTPSM